MYICLKLLIMKKTILFIGVFALCLTSYGQVLQAETFDNLTLGNVGTAIDGSVAGQASFLTLATNGAATSTTTNAANSNFVIGSIRGATDQSVNITSPNGSEGIRFMWQDGLDTAWTTRTAGNDVIDIEFTFNTGSFPTSRTNFGMRLFDASFNTIIGYSYDTSSRILSGLARLNNNGTEGNFRINLAAAPGLQLAENTTYRLGMSYNTVTGEILWKTNPNTPAGGFANTFWVPNLIVTELDFVALPNPANATATPPVPANTLEATLSFFDFTAEAVATSDLLSNEDDVLDDNYISVFPNPANEVINVRSNTQLLSSLNIVDLNGRLVKSVDVNATETSVNVENLRPGLYLLNISSSDATITRKFIKE